KQRQEDQPRRLREEGEAEAAARHERAPPRRLVEPASEEVDGEEPDACGGYVGRDEGAVAKDEWAGAPEHECEHAAPDAVEAARPEKAREPSDEAERNAGPPSERDEAEDARAVGAHEVACHVEL